MKIPVTFFMLLMLGVPLIAMDSIGAVSVGANNYLGVNSFYDEIEPSGVAIGLIVPVRFPNRPVHLKMRAAMHDVDPSKYNTSDASFLQVVNEILVGYDIIQRGQLRILPQLGLGAGGERYKVTEGVGGAHVDVFVDLSCRIDYVLPHFNLGALVNFERDLNLGLGSFLSANRLNVTLIISK